MKYIHVVLLNAFALVACAAPQTAPQTPPAPQAHASQHGPGPGAHGMMGPGHKGHDMMSQGMADCPMAIAGTTARSEDVEGGAAMVFSTTGDVAELRRRVAAMAQMHNKHAGAGCPMMAMHAGGPNAAPAPTNEHDAHHPKSEQPSPAKP